MTTYEQKDTVLKFFKERGQELKLLNKIDEYYLLADERVEIDLHPNNCNGWKLRKIRNELVYSINNLPFNHKELIVLLNILNPLPE